MRDAQVSLDVQEKLPIAVLVQAMPYMEKNTAREAEYVTDWLGAQENLTDGLGVKEMLLSMLCHVS